MVVLTPYQIIVGFTGQAFISLLVALWVFFLSRHGRLDLRHEEGSDEHQIEAKRLELFTDILMVGNDIQMLTGESKSLSLHTEQRLMRCTRHMPHGHSFHTKQHH